MSVQKDIQLIPERKRILWYYVKVILVFDILWVLLAIIGSGIQNNKQWYIEGILFFALFFVIILLLVNREQRNNILTISSSGITGPKGGGSKERVFIAFHRINKPKSRKQNILQKILSNYCIYSESNEQIVITLQYYSKEQQNIFFDKIKFSLKEEK